MAGLAGQFAGIRDSVGPLCVGIDPSSETLLQWGLDDSAASALEMARVTIEAARTRAGIVKPQISFFERFGSAGFSAVETVIREARAAGLTVIADAKRGDIGSTMNGYASTWFGDGPLASDALTVNPYLGFESLEPAFAAAELVSGTVFVLCSTSNVDAELVQQATNRGVTVAQAIAKKARERSGSSRTVGLVVGATRTLHESALTDTDVEGLLILAPGFGAQGAELSRIREIFGASTVNVIPSVSRSVLNAGPYGIGSAIDTHRRELGL